MRKEQGITLVALVITVIILLILAGIALATLSGRDNIIKQSGDAVTIYNDQSNAEGDILNTINNKLQEYVDGKEEEVVVEYKKVQYTTVGTHTFTVPADVKRIKVTVAGAGGGAGGDLYGYTLTAVNQDKLGGIVGFGADGGRGEVVEQVLTVTPGAEYQIVVGAGGTGGFDTNIIETSPIVTEAVAGGKGGTSSFGEISAQGGEGGTGSGYNGSTTTYSESSVYNGTKGTSYGAGGAGGVASKYIFGGDEGQAKPGSAGWVYVEYGGEI